MVGKQGDEGTMMPGPDSEWPHDDSIKVEQKGREYRGRSRLQPNPGCFSFQPEKPLGAGEASIGGGKTYGGYYPKDNPCYLGTDKLCVQH